MKPSCLFVAIAVALAFPAEGRDSGTASQTDAVVADAYLISGGSAGPFRLGDVIPYSVAGFVMRESDEEKAGLEGETVMVTAYVYEIGNEGWVKVTPQYDPATGQVNNDRIGEIFVYSDLFLTDRGIGAMSSIEGFAAAYPDLSIRYADDEELFIVETPQLPCVQFLLERESGSCFTAIRLMLK